jgi:hypothetical protein
LRGAGTTDYLSSNLLFDCIVGVAMFTRFFVQGVRLLLILFVYTSLQDLWLFNDCFHANLYAHESFVADMVNLELSLNSISFFTAFKVPFYVWYLLVETGHVFFVMTAQFFSFFAMIF